MIINQQRIAGILALILVAAGLVIWVVMSRPNDDDIAARVTPVPSLPTTIFTSDVVSSLSDRLVFGSLPVSPRPADPARGNPFEE